MKLAFSTNRWQGYTTDEFFAIAEEYRFKGVEIHSVEELGDLNLVYRKLTEYRLSVPCIDLVGNVGDKEKLSSCISEFSECLKASRKLRIPYVRIRAMEGDNADGAVREFLTAILPDALKDNVTVLVETVGLYADTAHLRELLNEFASDALGALWDLCYPYTQKNETPQQTITNLGAYVKHVHIKDADKEGFSLVGEGELPIKEFLGALRSVNYDGFICLEWDPNWLSELDDIHIIFPHFVTYMSAVDDTKRAAAPLYDNNAGTGKRVWKKEILIEKTFSQVLDTMVENFPDQYAFKYTTLNYTRTYAQFRDDVDDFARSLIAMGVKPGSHVAVWASNVPQWYVAFWATTKIGAVLVTVNTAYKIHEAEYLLKQSDTHTLIMEKGSRDSHYDEIIAELCPELENKKSSDPLHAKRLPFLRNVITVGYRQKGCMTWDEAVSLSHKVPVEEVYRRAAAVNVHDVANMQYTSGTTGFPKGVMLTHYNIVNNGKCIGDRMDLSTADRMMIQVPMFHCFGMVLAMTASMTHGATLHPIPYFSAKSSLACIHNEHITAFHGVPTMFIALLEHPDFEKTDFSYMRTGIMAGSPCPISVMQDVVNKMNMKEITIVYGQTEASPGCTMSSTDDPLEVRVGTVGRALPEIECKIVDPETGEELPDNVTGEFVARGYNIMKGYYKMPQATAAAIDSEGWLHTGDLACRTPEGNFRITGRLKDMIIRGGENIYPKEIEEFIYTHPKVSDVQVIGVPDEQYGEEIFAAVILKDGESLTEAELKDYVLSHMAKHKVPKYVDFVDSFPMNVAGKILKYKMREDAVKKLGLQKASSIVTA
ncbi:MAG: AMP-dependent synthetase [Ruminococcaceae bacterium]|nr:AMP-dependent synthetase [Oscillospiraceae bacterium]